MLINKRKIIEDAEVKTILEVWEELKENGRIDTKLHRNHSGKSISVYFYWDKIEIQSKLLNLRIELTRQTDPEVAKATCNYILKLIDIGEKLKEQE